MKTSFPLGGPSSVAVVFQLGGRTLPKFWLFVNATLVQRNTNLLKKQHTSCLDMTCFRVVLDNVRELIEMQMKAPTIDGDKDTDSSAFYEAYHPLEEVCFSKTITCCHWRSEVTVGPSAGIFYWTLSLYLTDDHVNAVARAVVIEHKCQFSDVKLLMLCPDLWMDQPDGPDVPEHGGKNLDRDIVWEEAALCPEGAVITECSIEPLRRGAPHCVCSCKVNQNNLV